MKQRKKSFIIHTYLNKDEEPYKQHIDQIYQNLFCLAV